MIYRPEIDGLRAVAVLPVIIFHAGFEIVGGGFAGVDIFFVISGYLITTIILNELDEGRFSIVKFYERRARRILPALFFIVACTAVLAWMFLLRNDFLDFARSVIAVVTFSSNIYFFLEADYFDTTAELKPLLHTWSLAVEEQYYIIFPVLMMAFWRFGRGLTLTILIGIFMLSLGFAQMTVADQPMFAFYLLPTRAWEIMVGAFCAFYLHKSYGPTLPLITQQILSLLGLALICIAIFTFSKETPTPSVYMLLPTVGAGLIILFANEGTFVKALLSLRAMVGIGLISYSAYLWHQPVLSFLRHNSLEEPAAPIMLGGALLSLVLAWLTWRFVERPFRNPTFSRKAIFTGSFIGTTAFLAAGLMVHFNSNFPYGNGAYNRFDKEIALLNFENDNKSLQRRSWNILDEYAADLVLFEGDQDGDNTRDWFGDQDDKLNLLIVGNSHSKDLFNILFLSDLAQQHIQLGRYSAQIGDLQPGHAFFASPNYQRAGAVMIAARYYENRGDISTLEPLVQRLLDDGKGVVLVENIFEFPRYLGGNWTVFDKVVHTSVDSGILDPDAIVAAANKEYYDIVAGGQKNQRIIDANAEIARLKQIHPEIVVMDRMDYVCDLANEACFSANTKLEKFFPDYGHHTLAGAEFFARRVEEIKWLDPLIAMANARGQSRM